MRRELAEIALIMDDLTQADVVLRRLEQLVAHFYCQEGQQPVERETLRQLLYWRAVLYYQLSDELLRDENLFRAGYLLGTSSPLGEGLRGRFAEDSGIWDSYTRAIAGFDREFQRIPVHVVANRFPTRALYVDGEALDIGIQSGKPLMLFPGIHFLEARDSRNRMRAATFEVPVEPSPFVLDVGSDENIPPLPDEADELLWRKLQGSEAVILPLWLKGAMEKLMRAQNLAAIYIVGPEDDRTNGPTGRLLVAQLDATEGLVDIPEKYRGRYYLDRKAAEPAISQIYVPGAFEMGVGTSYVNARATSDLSFSWTHQAQRLLEIRLGALAQLNNLDPAWQNLRWNGVLWAGIGRGPATPALGWTIHGDLSLLLTSVATAQGSQWLAVPGLGLLGGIEIPLRTHLYSGRGARHNRLAVLRLEAGGCYYMPNASLFLDQNFVWMSRASLRYWQQRDAYN